MNSNDSICVVTIYRIPKIKSASLIDISWSDDEPMIWSVVEICVAIACACAITYRPLSNWIVGFNPSTAGSGPSGKRSKPSLGNISLPQSRQEGWQDIDDGNYKMQDIHVEQGNMKLAESHSKLRSGES